MTDDLAKKFGPTNRLAKELGTTKTVLDSDINDMGWTWEFLVASMDHPSIKPVLDSLRAICRSYLRGRDVRCGNLQGFERNRTTLAVLSCYIIIHICEGGKILYEALHEAGVDSLENFSDRLKVMRRGTIWQQVDEILHQGGESV